MEETMKKALFAILLSLLFALYGCAGLMPFGTIYSGVKMPMIATANSGDAAKKGEATCISILSLVAVGDCSIEAAKKDGGITKVSHVDWEVHNILGIHGKYKVVVSGD